MSNTKYTVFVDDGENKTTHDVFASSIEAAKNIILNNGIPPDNIVKVIEDGVDNKSNKNSITKTIKNPFTGEEEVVIEQVEQTNQCNSQNDDCNTLQSNEPQKTYNLNGIEIAIINGEMYTQSWVNVDESNQYRILNNKTEKMVKNTNYVIQKKTWIKLPTNNK